MELSIQNVINISVSQPGVGLVPYNTSNLALFTHEVPAPSFGVGDYKSYISPAEVAVDFGSSSITYQMALSVFSQQPNIRAGDGRLVVIPMLAEVQGFVMDGTPASGSFQIQYGSQLTAAIAYNDTVSDIQTKLRALTGLSQVVVTGDIEDFEVEMKGVFGNPALMTIANNTLETSAPAAVNITVSEETAGETPAAAITAAAGIVQFFGIMFTAILSQTELLAAAAVVQSMNKIMGAVANQEADIDPGGKLDLLRTGSFEKTRGLFRDDSDSLACLQFQAAYMGRALSVNFSGSNTTITMHLKDLNGIQPDPLINQTILDKCQTAGADVYISIQGVPKVFCSGANDFFDNVYNLAWFIGALEVALFNILAQTSTKIPQTESGMDVLKSGARIICEQGVTNQFLSPGSWTAPETFGPQEDFFANILQRGYFIYSAPISQQSPAEREEREAPLMQIAIKYAGAIHKGSVIININK